MRQSAGAAAAAAPSGSPWPRAAVQQQQEDSSINTEQREEQLLGLWDSIWFGVDEDEDGATAGTSSRGRSTLGRLKQQSPVMVTADPLDNVVPLFLPLLPGMQQQQQPNGLAALVQQQQQQPSPVRYSAAAAAAAVAAIPALPSQPRPVWGPPGAATASAAINAASRAGGAHAYAVADSPAAEQEANGRLQQHQQHQQQSHRQQEQQPQSPLAPFVLGTWAQRQYIMPLQRPPTTTSSQQSAAGTAELSPGEPPRPGSSFSPSRPIPTARGKMASSSNGSTHSSGASTRSKAGAPASGSGSSGKHNNHKHSSNNVHSSSGASSEAVPAGAAQEAAADAAAAAADAAAAAGGGGGGGAGAAANGDDATAVQLWQDAAGAAGADEAAAARRPGRRSLGTEDEEEAVAQIAWRWRFARRWQQEQTRAPPDAAAAAASSPGDGMEEALEYLAACGENWHHLSRGSSQLGTVESRVLGTLGSFGCLGAELLADESFSAMGSGMQGTLQSTAESGGALAASCREPSITGDSSSDGQAQPQQLRLQQPQQQQRQQQQELPSQQLPLQQPQQQHRRRHHHSSGGVRPEATAQVTGITRRAHELLEAQKDISQAAQQRWQQVSGQQSSSPWVGALMEGAQVAPWGKFKFLLLRMREHGGRAVTLVRGENGASEAKIVEALHKQMMAACSAHKLPVVAIEVLGGGVMEWTQHRDRHLHISGGYVSRTGGPGGPATAGEVMRLTAVLTQQALPMHYKVTSEGSKQGL